MCNKFERQSYQTGVSRNASIVLERLRWGFLVACFLNNIIVPVICSYICLVAINSLVMNGFGLSPWSLLYTICASFWVCCFWGGKNQEQAHAVTIMSLQLVTFRREGSALKLWWLRFFFTNCTILGYHGFCMKNIYLSGRPSDGWPEAEKHHCLHQHEHQDQSGQGASIPDICKFWYTATLFRPE